MKFIELPVVYLKNYKEVREAEEKGYEIPEREEEVENTTLFLPDEFYLRINPYNDKRTTLHFSDTGCYVIDNEYEAVSELLKGLLK